MPGVAQPSSDLRHSLNKAISAKSKMETPVIKPPKGRQYKVKQSRYKALADVNPCRCIVLGSSGAGKDVWLTSFFTDIMKLSLIHI